MMLLRSKHFEKMQQYSVHTAAELLEGTLVMHLCSNQPA